MNLIFKAVTLLLILIQLTNNKVVNITFPDSEKKPRFLLCNSVYSSFKDNKKHIIGIIVDWTKPLSFESNVNEETLKFRMLALDLIQLPTNIITVVIFAVDTEFEYPANINWNDYGYTFSDMTDGEMNIITSKTLDWTSDRIGSIYSSPTTGILPVYLRQEYYGPNKPTLISMEVNFKFEYKLRIEGEVIDVNVERLTYGSTLTKFKNMIRKATTFVTEIDITNNKEHISFFEKISNRIRTWKETSESESDRVENKPDGVEIQFVR